MRFLSGLLKIVTLNSRINYLEVWSKNLGILATLGQTKTIHADLHFQEKKPPR